MQDILALPEAIKEDRHGAKVDSVRAEPHQMALDAGEFGQQHADPLRPRWDLQFEQFLRRQTEPQVVGEWRKVIHAVGERDPLGIGLALEGFLEAGMQIADIENGSHDRFTFQIEHQPQHPMRRGMLRAHAENDPFFLARDFFQRDRHYR